MGTCGPGIAACTQRSGAVVAETGQWFGVECSWRTAGLLRGWVRGEGSEALLLPAGTARLWAFALAVSSPATSFSNRFPSHFSTVLSLCLVTAFSGGLPGPLGFQGQPSPTLAALPDPGSGPLSLPDFPKAPIATCYSSVPQLEGQLHKVRVIVLSQPEP